MARVRAIVEGDVPRIAELHLRVFGGEAGTSARVLESHLLEVLCRHPWRSEGLPSLLCEEDGGRIVGCLGVMPRPMSIGGEPILAAVTHNFMVEPDRRSTLAAMELLKAFFSGPQALSLAEGNGRSRKLWEAAGGTTSLLHSIRWTHPLRPARYALALLEKRGLPGWCARPLRPFCAAADLAAALVPGGTPRGRPEIVAEDPDANALLLCVNRFSERRALRPRYDPASLEWLLRILSRSTKRGTLRKLLLRREGRVVGWCLYYTVPGGIGEVVQIGATEDSAEDVLDHLFRDAWRHGAIAVSGQFEPSLVPALSEKLCLFHRSRGGSWVLVHSRRERLLHSLLLGDAFFTRLEGEWWIAA